MTVMQKKTDSPIAHLTPEDIETLGVDLDAIRQSSSTPAATATRRTSAR